MLSGLTWTSSSFFVDYNIIIKNFNILTKKNGIRTLVLPLSLATSGEWKIPIWCVMCGYFRIHIISPENGRRDSQDAVTFSNNQSSQSLLGSLRSGFISMIQIGGKIMTKSIQWDQLISPFLFISWTWIQVLIKRRYRHARTSLRLNFIKMESSDTRSCPKNRPNFCSLLSARE